MKKFILCLFLTTIGTTTIYAQVYHEKDKEGLRNFIRQEYNRQRLNLTTADTTTWNTSEKWIKQIEGLTWSDHPYHKHLLKIDWSSNYLHAPLMGKLDAAYFTELTELYLHNCKLTDLNLTQNKKTYNP